MTCPRPILALWLALGLCSAGNSAVVAGCQGLSAETVGRKLGSVLVELAKAFVDARIWDNPDCRSPKSPEEKRLCSLADDVDAAVERVNKAVDHQCFDPKGSFVT